MAEELGKKAEKKIREWLDDKEHGYSFDRFYDQMTGFYMTSRNICDFLCYKHPYLFYIESKATMNDRFEFSRILDHQYEGLMEKSTISGCYGLVFVLFASQKRAFIFDIREIDKLIELGRKSVNITKINKWTIPYYEIPTVPNNRKQLLDYTGDLLEILTLDVN